MRSMVDVMMTPSDQSREHLRARNRLLSHADFFHLFSETKRIFKNG